MVIIRLTGGLGNQMFQYAAGRASAIRNKTELLLDTTYYDVDFNKQVHETNLLINLFPNIESMSLMSINRNELADISRKSCLLYNRAFNKARRLFNIPESYRNVLEQNLLTYQPSFHTAKAKILHLSSDWQNEKYFSQYESIIRGDFKFPEIASESLNGDILSQIKDTNSISIHVRRGDYLISAMHQPTSLTYYQEALKEAKRMVAKPKFFIFSDDIAWCEENLSIPEATYINHNFGTKSYIDMQLMSSCKHNIIANSSFSWWGAWLNQNANKLVIAPKIWLAKSNIPSSNIIPPAWISI